MWQWKGENVHNVPSHLMIIFVLKHEKMTQAVSKLSFFYCWHLQMSPISPSLPTSTHFWVTPRSSQVNCLPKNFISWLMCLYVLWSLILCFRKANNVYVKPAPPTISKATVVVHERQPETRIITNVYICFQSLAQSTELLLCWGLHSWPSCLLMFWFLDYM